MNLLLRSRKVQRFFDRRFQKAESLLVNENQEANVRAERPHVDWADVPDLSNAASFYSFHDQNCPDVVNIPTKEWWCSHFRGRYRLHAESDEELSYEVAKTEEGIRLAAPPVPGIWIYGVSRAVLPAAHAIEFDFTPSTTIKEQLQLDFAATSLADRHRFILSYNEKLRYQRIERGFWLPDIDVSPWSLPVGRTTRIRLEVVGQVFALLADGETVACWRDRRYKPRPSRTFLIFWNGSDERPIDVRVERFRVQFAKSQEGAS